MPHLRFGYLLKWRCWNSQSGCATSTFRVLLFKRKDRLQYSNYANFNGRQKKEFSYSLKDGEQFRRYHEHKIYPTETVHFKPKVKYKLTHSRVNYFCFHDCVFCTRCYVSKQNIHSSCSKFTQPWRDNQYHESKTDYL